MAESASAFGSSVPDADRMPSLRREVALIGVSAGVGTSSIRVGKDARGRIEIGFTLETGLLGGDAAADILDAEPIALVYGSEADVGVVPPTVLSGRPDFPRNLGHVNPGQPDEPASLCLARAGLQQIYDRHGVEGVLERLRQWLDQAKCGTTMSDGWEPVPPGVGTDMGGMVIDAAFFQDLAASKGSSSGCAAGVATVLRSGGSFFVLSSQELSPTPNRGSSASPLAAGLRARRSPEHPTVPWVFVWAAEASVTSEPIFGAWQTLGALFAGLKAQGIAELADKAIGQVLIGGAECHDGKRGKALVLVVGIWRPRAIMQNIYGLSEDMERARRLELRAFAVHGAKTEDLVKPESRLVSLVGSPVPGSALNAWVSGYQQSGGVAILGYGSLGSAVVNHLMRAGVGRLTVIDGDLVQPHNLARHAADIDGVWKPKVEHFKQVHEALHRGDGAAVAVGHAEDVLQLDDAALSTRVGMARLIIDCTADERVRGRLHRFGKTDGRQMVRGEIYRRGRIGVQFATGPEGNPGLLDLYYALAALALTDGSVREWLAEDFREGTGAEELLFGFGCASMSTRLPGFVVAQHASTFMPTIMDGLLGSVPPGIGLNILDEGMRPTGWRWFDVPVFREHRIPVGDGEWAVRFHPDILDRLAAMRAGKLPAETGGYLYGGLDIPLRHMTILFATGEPPGTVATPASLRLGPAGRTDEERRLTEWTARRLKLCGTWHSHPGRSATPSPTDIATIYAAHADDMRIGLPTLMTVVADGVFLVQIAVPDS